MSYDLRIWSKEKIGASQRVVKTANYFLSVEASLSVDSEDIPAKILLSIPEINYLTELHLSPYSEYQSSVDEAKRYAKKLARQYDGVLEDLQQDSELYFGTKKQTFARTTRDSEIMTVTWYIDSKSSLSGKFSDLISILEKDLPQALPRRYGSFEPPQYKYEETGREHLLTFLTEESLRHYEIGEGDAAKTIYLYEAPIWYATKPLTYLFIRDAYLSEEAFFKGYRCNYLQLNILKYAYDEDNWKFAVKRLFKEVALLYQPFYAEIIDGREKGVVSWWWKGIPQKRGETIIIGNPYSSLLEGELSSCERLANGLYYLEDSSVLQIPKNYLSKKLSKITSSFKTIETPHQAYSTAKEVPLQLRQK